MAEEINYIVRVAGADLDGTKPAVHALTKVYGVGKMFSNAVLEAGKFSKQKKIGYYSEQEINKIEEIIKNPKKFNIPEWLLNRRKDMSEGKDIHVVSSDLKLTNRLDLEHLKKIKCYRGIRHMFGLKVRGQRTKSKGRKGSALGVSRRKQQQQQKKGSK